MNSNENFTFFWTGPFSQWHPSTFLVNTISFNCAEQYMMYCKAKLFRDDHAARSILASSHPREQKEIGRNINDFNEITWLLFREAIVFEGNYQKFTQNGDLASVLLLTKNTTLVEASPDDKIWGVGLSEDDPRILDPTKWKGTNLLGKALMKVRSAI